MRGFFFTYMRKNISSGGPWEDLVGYSRAVQIGNTLEIAGTTATHKDTIVGRGSAYEQTHFVLSKIQHVLEENGFELNDVVRTRMYVTDISKWEEVGKAHGEYFKTIKPAATMVEVSRLISDDLLVEIEVTAIKG